MAKPLTDEERTHIVELFATGKSCNAIAREVHRSTSTISNIARAEGHRFGQSNLAHARAARSAYGAETRARIAAKVAERLERLANDDDRWESIDNRDVRDLGSGMEAMKRVLIDIDRHDNTGAGDASSVDAWLAAMTGGDG